MDLGRYKIVKDPIYGYIKIYDHEQRVVDSSAFQRLRRIKQLSVADIVYPGATHARFSHSLGVAHVIEAMVRDIVRKYRVRQYDLERYVVLMRLLALLHDIGHGPFSHLFEDVVLIPRNLTHEDMSAEVVSKIPEVTEAVEKIINEYGYKLRDVEVALKCSKGAEWPFRDRIQDAGSEKSFFYILKGVYSADIIDYLLRDSYYTGAGYGSYVDWQRISYYLGIYGDDVVLDYRALDSLEQLMLARIYMFSTVYYHKTVRAASKFLGDIIAMIGSKRIIDFDEVIKNVDKYVELDDYSLIYNSNVIALKEVKEYLCRKIPYKLVLEYRLPLSNMRTPVELITRSKDVVETLLEVELRDRGLDVTRGYSFFIDTPKLSLNPMLSVDEIIIMSEGGGLMRRKVLEFTWFSMPKIAMLLRLYIRRELKDKIHVVREAFNTIFSEEVKSFY
uniref:HD domain-containing protein n=1 Tax=Ignisphaera aggregans TaxID=334771 RepID=A0A7J3Z6Z0_9CREN